MNKNNNHRQFCKLAGCLSVLLVCVLPASASFAQNHNNAFLACAEFSDRGQRIACLEDALESAVNAAESTPASSSAQAPVQPNLTRTTPAASSAPQSAEPSSASSSSFMDRIKRFGKTKPKASNQQLTGTAISTDENGEDQLLDTITVLEKRSNLWFVTLASGQVWRQQNTGRNYNLKEGDQIRIYRGGFGNGYRLEADRLSGFIRVERIK